MAEINRTRKKAGDSKTKAAALEITGDVLELDRPCKVNILITRQDLADLKSICVLEDVNQGDKLYLMFKDALNDVLNNK